MGWNAQRMRDVALASAYEDHAAFEAIGLSEIPDARVLDVGCFDGFNTVLKFAPYGNLAQVAGIDPLADALSLAASATDDGRFVWEQTSCENYAGADASFDVAYFGHSFQHLVDKEAALRNVLRLLKPGGFVVVKTVDDSCKISQPDPEGVMRRLFSLYERHVLPNTPHTRFTDRNNGSKCYSLLSRAGFSNVAVRTVTVDTAGKSVEERRALFERCAYFRTNVPDCVDAAVAREYRHILGQWEALFDRDDYYFASPTFVVVAQKPDPDRPPRTYYGPLFGDIAVSAGACSTRVWDGGWRGPAGRATGEAGRAGSVLDEGERAVRAAGVKRGCVADTAGGEADRKGDEVLEFDGAGRGSQDAGGTPWRVTPLTEADLGQVMRIELESFPDPWTPVAYAMELRYNSRGTYVAARNAQGEIGGYVGWWEAGEAATIANIAVDPHLRRSGVGRLLLDYACDQAAAHGRDVMQLQVRAQNATARAFYAAMGFGEMATSQGYYTNPDDDAIILARPLAGEAAVRP